MPSLEEIDQAMSEMEALFTPNSTYVFGCKNLNG